jgi:hypothetical protein
MLLRVLSFADAFELRYVMQIYVQHWCWYEAPVHLKTQLTEQRDYITNVINPHT